MKKDEKIIKYLDNLIFWKNNKIEKNKIKIWVIFDEIQEIKNHENFLFKFIWYFWDNFYKNNVKILWLTWNNIKKDEISSILQIDKKIILALWKYVVYTWIRKQINTHIALKNHIKHYKTKEISCFHDSSIDYKWDLVTIIKNWALAPYNNLIYFVDEEDKLTRIKKWIINLTKIFNEKKIEFLHWSYTIEEIIEFVEKSILDWKIDYLDVKSELS